MRADKTKASRTTASSDKPELVQTEDGLVLVQGDLRVRADFARKLDRLRPHNLQRELLVRAAKVKGPGPHYVVDATAGLGDDSLLLAAAGWRVTMFERNPTITALLADALERARDDERLAPVVARMELRAEDSVGGLLSLADKPDVVLLDPMFPAKSKSSLAKKKLQLIQQLESPCDDEEALLDAALSARPRKIVVKRPVKGPYLAGVKPSHSLAGKAIRYDCILVPA